MAVVATPELLVDPTNYDHDEVWRNFQAPSSNSSNPTATNQAVTGVALDRRAVLDFPDNMGNALRVNSMPARKAS